jgi:4-cresol dehydrogenase (hydroxylating)
VARIVAVANERRIPLYPFSTGKNWGLGSKLPVTDDCVIVDLRRMNRIIEVNEDFAYAILEPGVTQLQLAKHLNQHHPALTLNFTGSFAYTGIVGNVLERGDGGHARVDDLLGMRGILGSGGPFAVGGFWERVGTGSPSHVQRFTAGPDLCGLFCQSIFGFVTQMAFKLIRRPERRCVVWGTVTDAKLADLIDAIGRFTSQGAVNRGSVNVGYANRFVQAVGTMAGASSPTDAPPDDVNFYLLIGGTARSTDVLAEEIVQALAPLCAAHGTFKLGQRPDDHDPVDSLPPFMRPTISPLLGLPDASSIKLIYQLTGTPLPADESQVDADFTPFGMKTYIPIVPPRGADVRRAAHLVAGIRRRFGLNVKPSFFGDGRTLVTIHFRNDDPAQVRQAEACERALWDEMNAAGFPPYRVGIDQMQRVVESRPARFELVARLKAALDPNGIIAPGRYCPIATSPASPPGRT